MTFDIDKFFDEPIQKMVKLDFEPKIIDGERVLVMDAISKSYDYCDLKFQIRKDDGRYVLNVDCYRKFFEDWSSDYTYDSLEEVFGQVAETLVCKGDPSIVKFVDDFDNGPSVSVDMSEALRQLSEEDDHSL